MGAQACTPAPIHNVPIAAQNNGSKKRPARELTEPEPASVFWQYWSYAFQLVSGPCQASALGPMSYTGTMMSSSPLVTIAMPCCDDEPYIEACIRSVQTQDWPRDQLEIVVADGMSIDATREILARLAAEDARIHLVDNPARIQAAGLNECIRRARGDIIVRMDVHADYAVDFVRKCVEVLDRTGADNVGGAARPRAHTFFQRCVAAALSSPLGVGKSRHRKADAEGEVDSVWPGAFRREVFERVGTFDPRATTNEDAELNQRIVDAGGRVFMSREIVAYYYPRGSMRALARQYFDHGKGRARTLLKHGRFVSWRPALPFLWLTSEAFLLATSAWHPFGTWSVATYALVAGAEAVRVGRREGVVAIPVVWSIFPVLHVSHGAGFAAGLVRYALRPDWAAAERLSPVKSTLAPATAVA
jgi:succinoglycan biosynthesis protein ExoA